jgi:hypothetical protein
MVEESRLTADDAYQRLNAHAQTKNLDPCLR